MNTRTVDWEAAMTSIGVEYIASGNGVSSGEINIACPLCAKTNNPDLGFHLGLNSQKGVFGCWRNSSHSGGNPRVIFEALVGKQRAGAMMARFVKYNGRYTPKREAVRAKRECIMPKEVERMKKDDVFWRFLLARGFDADTLPLMNAAYKLCGAYVGKYAGRLIIPAFSDDGELLAFTARTIGKSEPKYLACDGDNCALPASDIFYGENLMADRCFVLLVEGALDCIKIMSLLPAEWQSALIPLAVGGKKMTKGRQARLKKLIARYNVRGLFALPDRDARDEGAKWLAGIYAPKKRALALTRHDDPGAFESVDDLRFIIGAILEK